MIELSVIIPTHNRASRLRACLEALTRQTQPPGDFDVIVVDDGSTDDTAQLLSQLEPPYSLRVIHQEKRGQSAARNRGAEGAGRYCLFIDDDVAAAPDLVAEHLKAQREGKGVLGIGPLIRRLPDSADWYTRHLISRLLDDYARLNEALRAPTWQDCRGGNLSIPRQALLAVGGFAVDLPAASDIDLGYRLQRSGVRIVYVPAACGVHSNDAGRHLLSEEERAGIMVPELIHRHPELAGELLGAFWATPPRAVLLRRLLLTLNIAPRALASVGPFLRHERWSRKWFSVVRSYAHWRGVRDAMPEPDTWRRLMHRTPILMYHAFGRSGEPASRFILPARRFDRQLTWLKRLGYRVLSLEDVFRYRRDHGYLPARSVVITIDDGYADAYSVAYPLLRRYGFPFTIFLVSDHVGDVNRWDDHGLLAGRPLVSWAEMRDMLRGGAACGAHTRTHARLPALSAGRMSAEIDGSREALERELGVRVRWFAYPFGASDAAARGAVERLGFEGACTTVTGPNTFASPRFELRRSEVRGTDSIGRFVLALWLGDDCLPRRGT